MYLKKIFFFPILKIEFCYKKCNFVFFYKNEFSFKNDFFFKKNFFFSENNFFLFKFLVLNFFFFFLIKNEFIFFLFRKIYNYDCSSDVKNTDYLIIQAVDIIDFRKNICYWTFMSHNFENI